MAEQAELGDVSPEEERRRPVDEDANLPRQEWKLVEVVGARHEPAREASEPQTQHLCDSLVATEGRHLSEHSIAIGPGLAGQVLRKSPRLPQRVLAGGRVVLAGCRLVRHPRSVPESPDVLPSFDL